jgi:hypothetical protein
MYVKNRTGRVCTRRPTQARLMQLANTTSKTLQFGGVQGVTKIHGQSCYLQISPKHYKSLLRVILCQMYMCSHQTQAPHPHKMEHLKTSGFTLMA